MKKTSATNKQASKQAARTSSTPPTKKAAKDTIAYWLDEARHYLDSDDLTGAIEAYQHATQIDPDCEFWVELGERYLNDRQLEKAFLAYEQANNLDPSSAFRASYWEWVGKTREACHDHSGALEAYSKWALAAPNSIKPIDRAGTLLVMEELWTDLPVLRNQYVERSRYKSGNSDEIDPEVLESMALYAYVVEHNLGSEEDPTSRELAYATLRDKYDSIPMRYLLGTLYYDLERWDSADTEFKRALKLIEKNPEWHETRFNLNWDARTAALMCGRIAEKQHRYSDALHIYQACMEQGSESISDSLEPVFEFLRLQLEQGEFRQVQDILEALHTDVETNLKQESKQLTKTVSPESLLSGDYLEEYPDYVHAMLMDRLTSWRHAMLLECYVRSGQFSKAEASLRDMLEVWHEQREEQEIEGEQPLTVVEDTDERRQLMELSSGVIALEQTSDLIKQLNRYCRKNPQDSIMIERLGRLTLQHAPEKRRERDFNALLEKFPQDIRLLELARDHYRQIGANLKANLVYACLNSLKANAEHKPICEWLTPACHDNPALLIAISARAFPGTGQIVVTGGGISVSAYAQIAMSYIRAEAEKLGVTGKLNNDIHIHLRYLGHKELSLTEFTQAQAQRQRENKDADKEETEEESCDENIGLALYLAILGALKEKLPDKVTLVGGDINLYGHLSGTIDLVKGLNALANYEDDCWERVILPRAIAPLMLQSGHPAWCGIDDTLYASDLSQVTEALSL